MWEDDINQVAKPRVDYQRVFHQEGTHFPFSQEEPIMCFVCTTSLQVAY